MLRRASIRLPDVAGNKHSGRKPAEPIDEALTVAVRMWLAGSAQSLREATTWALQITATKVSERTLRRHLAQWLKTPTMPVLGDQLVMEALANPGMGGMVRYTLRGRFVLKRRSTGDRMRDELADALQAPGSPRALAIERATAVMAALGREVQRELRRIGAAMDRLDAAQVAAEAERVARDAA
jgi:DNA-binding transcriptional ArsR family regulator